MSDTTTVRKQRTVLLVVDKIGVFPKFVTLTIDGKKMVLRPGDKVDIKYELTVANV